MSGYAEDAQKADAAISPAGAVDTLVEQTERLHHHIELLENHLSPVLRTLGPEKSLDSVPHEMTTLEAGVSSVEAAVERLIRLRDRLVV